MRAEKVGADTMLARIVHMVAEAQRSRARRFNGSPIIVSGWFVPAVIAGRGHCLRGWMIFGPPPRFRLCAGGGRFSRHHRLPVRARACHADVDHGRRRQRRDGRRPDQERRSARALREDRHAGRRQDRHFDRRQAARRRRDARRRLRRDHRAVARGEPRTRAANIRLPRPLSAAAKERNIAPAAM